jgi:hypothetical protein
MNDLEENVLFKNGYLENFARWAVPGALFMAVTWFASGIVAWVAPGSPGSGEVGELRHYLIQGLHGVGRIGSLAALVGLHVHQKATYGRMGNIGFWISFGSTALLAVLTIGIVGLIEGNLLMELLITVGVLSWVVGFSLLGIATLRAKVMPGWVGWLLIAFFPLALILFLVLMAYGVGGVAVGVLWLLLAYGLWSQERSVTR